MNSTQSYSMDEDTRFTLFYSESYDNIVPNCIMSWLYYNKYFEQQVNKYMIIDYWHVLTLNSHGHINGQSNIDPLPILCRHHIIFSCVRILFFREREFYSNN